MQLHPWIVALVASGWLLLAAVTQPAWGQPSDEQPDGAATARAAAEVEPPLEVAEAADGAPAEIRWEALVGSLTIFVLALFVGFEVITKVPPTLHTPLMSGSNAISGITVVGALVAAGYGLQLDSFVGLLAVVLATINVVGGFLVTHRMLAMFRKKKPSAGKA